MAFQSRSASSAMQSDTLQNDQRQKTSEIEPAIGIFRRPWVQTVLPFVTSLMVHAGILILGVVAVKLFATRVVSAVRDMEQIIIPESTAMTDKGPPGNIPHLGLMDSPFTDASQDQLPDSGKQDLDNKPGPTIDIQASAGSGETETSSFIGLGVGGPIGGGGPGNSLGGAGDGSGPLARIPTALSAPNKVAEISC